MKSEGGHLRNDMVLRSTDGGLDFGVFIRINEAFAENFSIGLRYIMTDEPGSVVLLRCNGSHGGYADVSGNQRVHVGFHIHEATAENIAMNLRAERGGVATREFASYQQALSYFVKRVRIQDADRYFPEISQPLLPFQGEESSQ